MVVCYLCHTALVTCCGNAWEWPATSSSSSSPSMLGSFVFLVLCHSWHCVKRQPPINGPFFQGKTSLTLHREKWFKVTNRSVPMDLSFCHICSISMSTIFIYTQNTRTSNSMPNAQYARIFSVCHLMFFFLSLSLS